MASTSNNDDDLALLFKVFIKPFEDRFHSHNVLHKQQIVIIMISIAFSSKGFSLIKNKTVKAIDEGLIEDTTIKAGKKSHYFYFVNLNSEVCYTVTLRHTEGNCNTTCKSMQMEFKISVTNKKFKQLKKEKEDLSKTEVGKALLMEREKTFKRIKDAINIVNIPFDDVT